MKYADRNKEFNTIEKFIKDDTQIIFVNANACTGFTSFLEQRFSEYKTYHIKYTEPQSAELTEKIFQQLNKDDLNILQRLVDNNYGTREKKILSALAIAIIPKVGEVLSTLNEGKKASSIYDMNYNIVYKLLPDLFNELAEHQKIGFFIDGAQFLKSSDYEFILNLSKIKNCYFIIGITQKTDDLYKLESALNQPLLKIGVTNFLAPSPELVVELAQHYSKEITISDAQEMIKLCDFNIYKIKNCLCPSITLQAIDSIGKAIIFLCGIITVNPSVDTVQEIINFDENIILDNENFKQALITLNRNEIVDVRENKVYLNNGHSIVREYNKNFSDKLYFENLLYNFYKKENTLSNAELETQYILSKKFDVNNTSVWLYKLILSRLQAGLTISYDLLDALKISNNRKLLIVVYTYLRQYEEALIYLKEIKTIQKLSYNFKNLYAVLLNRCRFHKKAQKKLLKCLKKEPNNYILKAYLASNYIHQEKIYDAQNLYLQDNNKIETLDKAYFYRNIGAAFWDNYEPFDKALNIFANENDMFGYYTTMCNYMTRKMILGKLDSIEETFLEIEKKLVDYGNENMHILYNNFGLAYLLIDDLDNAKKYFNLASLFSKSDMPDIFIKINQACLELKIGEKIKAKKIIDSLEGKVLSFPVQRVKQKFYINKLLIYFANDLPINDIITKCNEYPDRYDSDYTLQIANAYKEKCDNNQKYSSNDWQYGYCPCYLEYWYVNPLKLFSESIIDEVLAE